MTTVKKEPGIDEIDETFLGYINAVLTKDWDKAIDFFTSNAQGEHAILGNFACNSTELLAFMRKAPEDWSLDLVWHVAGCSQVLYKWKHTLPGNRPNGEPREFYGYCEMDYHSKGKFSRLKSYPDWHRMNMLKEEASQSH